jgi:guanylate kinase
MARFALLALFFPVLLGVRKEGSEEAELGVLQKVDQAAKVNVAGEKLCDGRSLRTDEGSGKPKKFFVDFDGVSAAGKGTMLRLLKKDNDFKGLFTELKMTFDREQRPGDDTNLIEFVDPLTFSKDQYAVVNAIAKSNGGYKHYAIKQDAINAAETPILISDIRPFRWPEDLTTGDLSERQAQRNQEKDLDLQSGNATLTPLTFFVAAINAETHKSFQKYLSPDGYNGFANFKTTSLEHTIERLKGRNSETADQIDERRKSNEVTLQNLYEVWARNDLNERFNIHFVVNDVKEETWKEVKRILKRQLCQDPPGIHVSIL